MKLDPQTNTTYEQPNKQINVNVRNELFVANLILLKEMIVEYYRNYPTFTYTTKHNQTMHYVLCFDL